MAKQKRIELDAMLADPRAVLARVESGRETISVMRGDKPVAVISPAPIAETLADLHRALYEEPLDTTFFLDIIETRRMLGL
ncbi:MAG: hypothetical protein QGM46_04520 [Actinomycetota bacterium]|nr:hypothetical protein [Actinomycetota bacterium]MDK1037926.1 hypothetical protein [Actinomycetota bacterium]MDK1096783.1 hypothetical protein [Actinomycetota bacterium]MDK1291600.1 hypothetical protein [Actinomycetota bacterium]